MTGGVADPADRLRARLTHGPAVLAPGVHDAVTARLATAAGVEAVHVSGAVVGATGLGLPDLGFVGATDMIEVIRRVAAGTDLPIIADADTGYGDPLQVAETTRRYERAGAAALHLEDQVMPKRGGGTGGARLVPLSEAVARVRAAVDARQRLLVIARTDALGSAGGGRGEALRRAEELAAAGADAIFVEGADAALLIDLADVTLGLPLVVNLSDAQHPPGELPPAVRLALFPLAAALAGLAAADAVYRAISESGRPPVPALGRTEFTDLLGLPGLVADERRWAADPVPAATASAPVEDPA